MPRPVPAVARHINLIVIHCSDTPNGRVTTAADIDRWHKERGFVKIGYHHVIRLDGVVEDGRSHREIGAHALNFNSDSLGICLIGRDKFTAAQWSALAELVRGLCFRYAVPASAPDWRSRQPAGVVGHRELPRVAKTCPGFSVENWLQRRMAPLPESVLTLED